MNVRPIPNGLLGDSITLITPNAVGYTETPISNVRVERSDSIEGHTSDDPRARSVITVWVDRHNSTWREFPVGAKVRYNNEVFEITEQKVYRAGEPHHCKFKAIKTGDDQGL